MAVKVKYLFKNRRTGKKSNKIDTALEWFHDGDTVLISRNGVYLGCWNDYGIQGNCMEKFITKLLKKSQKCTLIGVAENCNKVAKRYGEKGREIFVSRLFKTYHKQSSLV